MGFSVSASTLIIFIAVMVAASSIYGAWSFSQTQLERAKEDSQTDVLGQRQTSIQIVGKTLNSNTFTINISNNGSKALKANKTTVLLDGTVVDATFNVKGQTNTNLWLPGEYLLANVTRSTRPNRTKVVANNGVSDVES